MEMGRVEPPSLTVLFGFKLSRTPIASPNCRNGTRTHTIQLMRLVDLPLVVSCANEQTIISLPYCSFGPPCRKILRFHRVYVSRYNSYWAPTLLIHEMFVFPSFHDFPILLWSKFSRAIRVLLYGFFALNHWVLPARVSVQFQRYLLRWIIDKALMLHRGL